MADRLTATCCDLGREYVEWQHEEAPDRAPGGWCLDNGGAWNEQYRIVIAFCPFCGVRLEEPPEEEKPPRPKPVRLEDLDPLHRTIAERLLELQFVAALRMPDGAAAAFVRRERGAPVPPKDALGGRLDTRTGKVEKT